MMPNKNTHREKEREGEREGERAKQRRFHQEALLTTALSTAAAAFELPPRLTTWPIAARDVVFFSEILAETDVSTIDLETLANTV